MIGEQRLRAFIESKCPSVGRSLGSCVAAVLACLFLLIAPPAGAQSDPLIGVLSATGDAGLGVASRVEQSMYRDGRTRFDLVPLYMYEGKFVCLHAYRVGLKLDQKPDRRFDVFLSHRFEGFPYDRIPASLAGMSERAPGVDAGMSYRRNGTWGSAYAEYLHDISGSSHGSELRLGYSHPWRSGKLLLSPGLMFARRDAKLNNYYYGVEATEVTAERPAYQPGSGVNARIGLDARYDLTDHWRLLAGVSVTRWASGVRASPIVDNRVQMSGFVGAAYDFEKEQKVWEERLPLIVKVLYGRETDCSLLPVMRLSCTSTQSSNGTGVRAIEIGRPFIERLHGWPLDVVGYVGLLQHNEHGLQPDSWQINAYMKGFYYGFPWSERVRTRIGFGAGVSYAQRVPFVEAADQVRRGRNTSKLLNCLDPSIDVSVGDLLGVRALRQAYFGFGVSHRSGIFASSQLLGNVNGGSNYIYTYAEWAL